VFDEATIAALRSSSDVKSVEEDGIFHVTALVTQFVDFHFENHGTGVSRTYRRDAPWGLCRLSSTGKIENKGLAYVPSSWQSLFKIEAHKTRAVTYPYTYEEPAGLGVDIYLLGTLQPPSNQAIRFTFCG
jgi:hypothetical protein